MPEITSFCLTERPRSLQANIKRGYMSRLTQKVSLQLNGFPPSKSKYLYVRIIWAHVGVRQGDTDNIIKPIFDSMNGLVYSDDKNIMRVLSQRVDISDGAQLSIPVSGMTNNGTQEFIYAVSNNADDILYVEVGEVADSKETVFGSMSLERL